MEEQTKIVRGSRARAELSHEHQKLKALTGIRTFAACWVVAFHFRMQIVSLFPSLGFLSPLMESGYLGVDLFFGLSGFILAYNYLHRLGEGGTWKTRAKFLWLRLARVWPVHFFTMNVALLMVVVARANGITVNSMSVIPFTPLDYLRNLSLTHAWFSQGIIFNFPAWSVSAEWFAYLLFPLLALVVVRVRSLWGAWLGATTCYAVLGAALFAMYWDAPAGTSEAGFGFNSGEAGLRVSFEFLAGCFLFRVWELTGNRIGWRWLVPASAAGIVVGAVTIGITSPRGVVLAPLFGLLILGLAKGQGLGVRILSKPALVFGGEVSYALYMTHTLVQGVAVKLLPADHFTHKDWVVRAAVLAAYAIMIAVAAVLTYLVVEKPARNWLRSVRVFATPRSSETNAT